MSFLQGAEQNAGQENFLRQTFLRQIAMQLNQSNPHYGQREDGTGKGPGYMGAIQTPQGGSATELSIGVDAQPPYRGSVTENGRSYNSVPSIVPTLTADELQWLLSGNQPTGNIQTKAEDFARMRATQGKGPFRGWDETTQYPIPRGYR